MNKAVILILSIFAAAAIAAAGVFYAQSQKTQKALNEAEKELIYYKNTDLAKEAELLNLKLKNAEKDLAAAQKEATAAQARVKTLEGNLAKIPAYLSAIDALEDLTVNEGPTAAKMSVVDTKINALGDQSIANRWFSGGGRSSVDVERKSWGSGIYETEKALTTRIAELIR